MIVSMALSLSLPFLVSESVQAYHLSPSQRHLIGHIQFGLFGNLPNGLVSLSLSLPGSRSASLSTWRIVPTSVVRLVSDYSVRVYCSSPRLPSFPCHIVLFPFPLSLCPFLLSLFLSLRTSFNKIKFSLIAIVFECICLGCVCPWALSLSLSLPVIVHFEDNHNVQFQLDRRVWRPNALH